VSSLLLHDVKGRTPRGCAVVYVKPDNLDLNVKRIISTGFEIWQPMGLLNRTPNQPLRGGGIKIRRAVEALLMYGKQPMFLNIHLIMG
jgi:hypothetical protein